MRKIFIIEEISKCETYLKIGSIGSTTQKKLSNMK